MKNFSSTPRRWASPLVAALLLAPLAGRAQAVVSYGVRLGANLASASVKAYENGSPSTGLSESYSKSPILAPQFGVVMNVQAGRWAFQPALLFSQKGLKQQYSATFTFFGTELRQDLTLSSRVNYLELPLLAVYTPGTDHGLQFFAGPYVAAGVGGRANYTVALSSSGPAFPLNLPPQSGSAKFDFGNQFPEDDPAAGGGNGDTVAIAMTRRFDAGLTAGVGYRGGPLQVQLGYSLGLLNVHPDYPASYQAANEKGYLRALHLSATYFFGSKN